MKFEEWLSQQNGVIEVDCGCVTTEAFYHWMRVAYEAGNSPVIPDGYVMVPKEMTDEIGEAIAMQANCCGGIALDIYDSMLAAAPQSPGSEPVSVPGKWIPVSERMPEKGQAVLVYRPKAHEGGDSDVRVAVYGRHNFEHGFGCYWEPSHWMPLPAAPQEVK
ncbi:TPA: DUF551 domain-containing protein [Klebsiella pneumoniae]|nr:DUF551 domain-containing protein [Klebsiella pneumoniae]RIU77800.1 DUF551 domain-containing protein [Klebsiella pneumoniae]WVH75999.1 DUF551 domain-containing protein [Klebsiella pneumoniae]HBR3080416.1 DUF551 domain-containing protein [Klebsiella pneumoniae]HBX3094171.1 DUF551 domain-containing protein [Klebsiella pneumoniae]HBX3173397.1 DUF551 domain-containing protein [Klebsiella pneumoniae]